jgi:hypothetical protein
MGSWKSKENIMDLGLLAVSYADCLGDGGLLVAIPVALGILWIYRS